MKYEKLITTAIIIAAIISTAHAEPATSSAVNTRCPITGQPRRTRRASSAARWRSHLPAAGRFDMKTHLIIAATLLLAGAALADSYRIHYTVRGSGPRHHRASRIIRGSTPNGHGHVPRRGRHRRAPRQVSAARPRAAICPFPAVSGYPGASRQSPCAAACAQVSRKKLAPACRLCYLEQLR